MSTDPTEFAYPPKIAGSSMASVMVLGWILIGASFVVDIFSAINYGLALRAAHTYMTDDFNRAIAFIMVLAPVLELNLGVAIVGACMHTRTAGRLLGSLAVLLASAAMTIPILLVYGIPQV